MFLVWDVFEKSRTDNFFVLNNSETNCYNKESEVYVYVKRNFE